MHTVVNEQQIKPGGNKATLTLADGSIIVLDSIANGALAIEAGTQVLKQGTGMLVYQIPNEPSRVTNKKVAYNTISTPKGGQYQVALPDGTKIWLNAASDIKFPTSFEKERKVTITGEVYFEVAPDNTRPFRVFANGTEINVLGTNFNVKAYPEEEKIKTTLLSGKVQIKTGNTDKVLKPGQKAEYQASGDFINLDAHADIEEITSWKNGLFIFNNTPLQEVMRQLSRWYDVTIEYKDYSAKKFFTAEMKRNEPISKVIEMMELTGIAHFRVSNKTVTVSQ